MPIGSQLPWLIPEDAIARVANFAESHGGAAFTNVPVAGPPAALSNNPRWHTVDAVWFPGASPSLTMDWQGDDDRYEQLLDTTDPVILNPRGYLDRTGFGMLVAGRELLGRTISSEGPVHCVALTDLHRPRAERVYVEFGIEVHSLTDEEASEGVRPGGGSFYEDRLLALHYAITCRAHGLMLTEMPVRPWRLDGLYMPTRRTMELRRWTPADSDEFQAGEPVEVIEVKRVLDTNVIGQAICGAARLKHDDLPLGDVTARAVVGGDHDPALEWVCSRLNVEVSRHAIE